VQGKNISVKLTEAILLSSKVISEMRNDASRRSFLVNTKDLRLEAEDFERFLSFSRSGRFGHLSTEDGLAFLNICCELGNDSLSLVVLALLHGISMAGIELDFIPGDSGLRSISLLDADLDYCASLFHLFSVKELRLLNHSLLHNLLKSKFLTLQSEDSLVDLISALGLDSCEYWDYVELEYLSDDGIRTFVDRIEFSQLSCRLWNRIVNRLKNEKCPDAALRRFVRPLESKIVSRLPSILSQFINKKFVLLYRGSSDGFTVSAFHGKCDNSTNTITFIETTTGCIFGGFTPIVWDSSTGHKSDPTKQSFLFRVKDWRNSAPRAFPLSNSSSAIFCSSSCGPSFGSTSDLFVADRCNENKSSSTNLGSYYVNDAGINGNEVFTGESNFTVKEIEVFKITE
jgi:hypothetical protein